MLHIRHFFLAALCLLAYPVFAQQPQPELFYRVYFEANAAELKQLSESLTFEHLAKNGDGYSGEFSATEKDILLQKARNAKVLITDMANFYKQRAAEDIKRLKPTRSGGVPANFHFGSMGGYLTLNEAIAQLDSMVLLYPNLVQPKQTIGTTTEGRPIYMYKLSDNPLMSEAQEQKALFTALHHAREPQSMAQMVYYMWYLLENYSSTDSLVQHILNDRELFFIPILNPDGYAYNELTDPSGGGMWRKNRSSNAGGSYGVDLNRNYGFNWGYDNLGSSPDENSLVFRGASAFSEPETQTLRDFCLNTDFKLILNYHSYGEWLIHPWSYANLITTDHSVFTNLADRLTTENNYIAGTCMQTLSYLANGGSDDWLYGEQTLKPKMFAFTPEVGSATDGFWPAPSQIIPIAQQNMHQNIMASLMAGPYLEKTRLSPFIFDPLSVALSMQYTNYGLDTCLHLSSWFESSNPFVLSSDTFQSTNLLSQQTVTGSIPVALNPGVPGGTVISGRVYTNYNNFLISDTASFVVKAAVGMQDLAEESVSVWPNPASDFCRIRSTTPFDQVLIRLYDISGREIKRVSAHQTKECTIDLRDIAAGTYLLEIDQKNSQQRTKIIRR
jgi:carboxypeptidase T